MFCNNLHYRLIYYIQTSYNLITFRQIKLTYSQIQLYVQLASRHRLVKTPLCSSFNEFWVPCCEFNFHLWWFFSVSVSLWNFFKLLAIVNFFQVVCMFFLQSAQFFSYTLTMFCVVFFVFLAPYFSFIYSTTWSFCNPFEPRFSWFV